MKIPPLISYLGKSVGFGLTVAALLLLLFPSFRGGAPLPGLITNSRELSFSYAAHRAGPAVVNIYTRSFAPNQGNQGELRPQGLGSGVIMNQRGYVLTNYHVIADADQIMAWLGTLPRAPLAAMSCRWSRLLRVWRKRWPRMT